MLYSIIKQVVGWAILAVVFVTVTGLDLPTSALFEAWFVMGFPFVAIAWLTIEGADATVFQFPFELWVLIAGFWIGAFILAVVTD